MQARPIFLGEADFERWLSSALEAESQRLKLQVIPSAPGLPPNRTTNRTHSVKELPDDASYETRTR